MNDLRRDHRLRTVGMPGTIIVSDHTDIPAALDIIGSEAWNARIHPYYTLCAASVNPSMSAVARRNNTENGVE